MTLVLAIPMTPLLKKCDKTRVRYANAVRTQSCKEIARGEIKINNRSPEGQALGKSFVKLAKI